MKYLVAIIGCSTSIHGESSSKLAHRCLRLRLVRRGEKKAKKKNRKERKKTAQLS